MEKRWKYSEFQDLFSFVIGGDWGKDVTESDPDLVKVYCIRGSEIRDWRKSKGKTAALRKISKPSLEKRRLQEGDILVEISGGGPDQPVGRTVLIDNEALSFEPGMPKVCTNFFRMVRLVESVDKKFVNHYLNYFYSSGQIVNYQGGSNNLRNLRFPEYSKIKVPLPPLPEQKRIVAKLDTLFAHLDQLRMRLEKIPVLLKQFRQAVLTQAVTGKLTEEWRAEAETGFPKSWKYASISEVSSHILGKMLDVNKNKGELTYYLRNQNVRWGSFDLIDISRMQAMKDERSKYSVKDGDILICEGGEPGRSAVWRNGNNEFIFQKALHRLRCHNFMEPDWIVYNITRDAISGNLQSLFTGTTIKHLTLRSLSAYKVPVPPLIEQKEIIYRVESLFGFSDRIEASYQLLKEKIDHLPQTVLSKAFRGELVKKELKEYAQQTDNLLLAAEP